LAPARAATNAAIIPLAPPPIMAMVFIKRIVPRVAVQCLFFGTMAHLKIPISRNRMTYRIPLILATAATFAFAEPSTLAVVNGQAITSTDANTFISKALPGATFEKLDPKMKRQVVDQLVNQALIRGVVLKSGIQSTPQFQMTYAALKNDLAVDMWMKQQMAKITVSEAEAKEFYTANKEKIKQNGKEIPFDKAKMEIMQLIKIEKFKAYMGKTTESLRAASKVEVKL
jgi:hypothetical protein